MAPVGLPIAPVAAPADAPGDDPVEQSSFTMGNPRFKCLAVDFLADSTLAVDIIDALCDAAGILVLLMVLWSSVGHQVAARCGCWLTLESVDAPQASKLHLLPMLPSKCILLITCACVSRSKYIGDASTACAMGLFTGLTVLVLQRYISQDAVHQLLTFNPAEFFT